MSSRQDEDLTALALEALRSVAGDANAPAAARAQAARTILDYQGLMKEGDKTDKALAEMSRADLLAMLRKVQA